MQPVALKNQTENPRPTAPVTAIIRISAEKKRRPREEDEVAAGLIGPGRRWGRSDIGASKGLLKKRGDPGEEDEVAAGAIGSGRRWSLSYNVESNSFLNKSRQHQGGGRIGVAAFATDPGRRWGPAKPYLP